MQAGDTLAEVLAGLANEVNVFEGPFWAASSTLTTLTIESVHGGTFELDASNPLTLGGVDVTFDESSDRAVLTTRNDGINYHGFETLNIWLGSGSDSFNVQGTSALTNISLGDGDDFVFISSEAAIAVGDDTDFLEGHLHDLTAPLNIDFGAGSHQLMVSDERSPVADTNVLFTDQDRRAALLDGSLPDAELYVFGLAPATMTFTADAGADFNEGVTFWTGFGSDVIEVEGTLGGTPVDTTIRSTNTLNTGLGDDMVTVNLDTVTAIEEQTIVLPNGTASADLTLPDVLVAGVPVTFTLFAGLNIADIQEDFRDAYGLTGTANESALIVTVDTTSGDNVYTVRFEGALAGTDVAEITTTTPGVTITTEQDGEIADRFFVLNGQGAYQNFFEFSDVDTILASASTLPLVIFGGQDDDVIEGGSSGDVIFGDRGRVDYFDDAGVLVARLGNGGPGDLTDGVVRAPVMVYTVDPLAGGNDQITDLGGNDIIFGGINRDTINALSGINIVFGDHGIVDYISDDGDHLASNGGDGLQTVSADIDRIFTLDEGLGGNDLIITVGGDDIIIAGEDGKLVSNAPIDGLRAQDRVVTADTTGIVDPTVPDGDVVFAGNGDNIVFGDAGFITSAVQNSPDISGFDLTLGLVSTERDGSDPRLGGSDTIIVGIGNDIVLGGIDDDLIVANSGETFDGAGVGNDGRNLVIGDHGEIDFVSADGDASDIDRVVSTSTDLGGVDTIITGDNNDIVIAGEDGQRLVSEVGGDGLLIGVELLVPDADPLQGDIVLSGAGTDLVLGDSGELISSTIDNASGIFPFTLELAVSTSPELGGRDLLVTDDGFDVVIGGFDRDTIFAGGTDDAQDVVIGDSGQATFNSNGILVEIVSTAETIGDNDLIVTGEGPDIVLGGRGGDNILVASAEVSDVFGPATALTDALIGAFTGNFSIIPVGDDASDVVVGDNGRATFTDTGELIRIETTAPQIGGNDLVISGNGTDVVIGGSANDLVIAGGDDASVDIVIGDNGFADFDPTPGNGVLDFIETQDPGFGGNDTINTFNGPDVVLAGSGNDNVDAGGNDDAADIVVGDNGLVNFDPTTNNEIVRFISTTAPTIGGDDFIQTFNGPDLVFGGTANDTIEAGGNDAAPDIVVGDNGQATFDSEADGNVLRDIRTTDPDQAGDDIINTFNGPDLVFGGALNDTIDAGGDDAAADIVVGDNGFAIFDPVTNSNFLRILQTTDPLNPGDDFIQTFNGPDIVLAGTGNDEVQAGGDDAAIDVVFGDNALINFAANGLMLNIQTIDEAIGGVDTIVTFNGPDIIFGGADGDIIFADDTGLVDDNSADIVLGDNGFMTFQTSATFDPGEEASIISFNFGVSAPVAPNFILGQAGVAEVRAGNWNNLVGGGANIYGDEAEELVVDDQGETVPGVTVEWRNEIAQPPEGPTFEAHDQITPTNDDLLLFEQYLKTNDQDAIIVTVAGLAPHFRTYDVFIYLDTENVDSTAGSSVRSISDGTTTFFLDDPIGNTFTGTYVEVTSTDENAPEVGNYVVFRGLTSDSFTIRVAAEGGANPNLPSIAGMQISGLAHPIDRIESTGAGLGGNDQITTGGGADLIIGGDVDDIINSFGPGTRGDLDDDLITGDHGRATVMLGEIREFETIFPDVGGKDTIASGNGDDLILGGVDEDNIDSGTQAADALTTDVTTLNLNFTGNVAKSTVTGTAGVVQTGNWNNLDVGLSGATSASGLTLSDGSAATGVNVSFGQNLDTSATPALGLAQFNIDNPDTQNARLFEGYIGAVLGSTLGVDVTGLSSHFTGAYDVYIYIDGDDTFVLTQNTIRLVTLNGETLFIEDPLGNNFAGEFIEVGATSAVGVEPGNYVVFRDVTGDSFSLRIGHDDPIGFPFLTGIQVVGGSDKDTAVDPATGTYGGDFDSDVVLGDNGLHRRFNETVFESRTSDAAFGGSDSIFGGEDGDVLIGGTHTDPTAGGSILDDLDGDYLSGEGGNDLLIGDNAKIRFFDFTYIGRDDIRQFGTAHYLGGVNEFDPNDVFGIVLLDETIGNNDFLEGGLDDDLMYGQFGNDTYVFAGNGLGSDRLVERDDALNDTNDSLDFSNFGSVVDLDLDIAETQSVSTLIFDTDIDLSVTLFSVSAFEGVTGSAFDDALDGNARANFLDGFDGNDSIDGDAGDDTLMGGAGNDLLVGDLGNDIVHGGAGDDDIFGNEGDDLLLGAAGEDNIQGQDGEDLIDGGADNDTLSGGQQNDVILGGEGDDNISGDNEDDLIDAEGGNDTVDGGFSNDVILGGDGTDTLSGGPGANVIEGGNGIDTINGVVGGGSAEEQAQAPGPLGVATLLGDFGTLFDQPNYVFNDPGDPINDRPIRPWLQELLDTVPETV